MQILSCLFASFGVSSISTAFFFLYTNMWLVVLFIRQLKIQGVPCKRKPLQLKVQCSTRNLGSHQSATVKGPKIINVKPFKRENRRFNLYKKRETRITYVPFQQTTTTKNLIPDLRQVQTNAAGSKVPKFNISHVMERYLRQIPVKGL